MVDIIWGWPGKGARHDRGCAALPAWGRSFLGWRRWCRILDHRSRNGLVKAGKI